MATKPSASLLCSPFHNKHPIKLLPDLYRTSTKPDRKLFAQVYIACQILWISLLILPFTGTAHLNDIFDLSYKAIFILFVWDYRQLFGLSWWKSFCRTIIMFWYCFLGLLLVCSIIIGIIVLIAYIIQWGK